MITLYGTWVKPNLFISNNEEIKVLPMTYMKIDVDFPVEAYINCEIDKIGYVLFSYMVV